MSQQPLQSETRKEVLDEREAFLDKAEEAFRNKLADQKDLEAKLAVLDNRLNIKQQVYDQLNDKIDKANKQFDLEAEDYEKQLQDLGNRVKTKEARSLQLEAIANQLSLDIRNRKSEVTKINDEIKDSKRYLQEQETVVNDTMAEWNVRLNELATEARNTEEEKKTLLRDMIRLDQEKTSTIRLVDASKAELATCDAAQQHKIATATKDLETALKELEKVQNNTEALKTKNTAAEKGFTIREKSLDLREHDLESREMKVAQEQRYIESRLSMI